MTKYEKVTLTKATLQIEDCFFIDCTLTDCDLFYSGGDFEWANTRFDNCRFHWRGPALKTLQLQQTIGMLKVQPIPVLSQTSTAKAN